MKKRMVIVYGTIGVSMFLFACAAYYRSKAIGAIEAEEISRNKTIYGILIGITFVILAALTVYQILPYIKRNEIEIQKPENKDSGSL